MTSPAAVRQEERVAAFARARFGPDARVEALTGDASDRRFFRLRPPGLSPMILMLHADPFDLDSMPFFLHARFFHDLGAPVPQIIASYPGEGILLVQDLGDETLQTHLDHCGPDRRRFLYLQAVRVIAQIQREGTPALTPDLPAATTALDVQRLHWELEFFRKHYVEGLLGSPLGPAASDRFAAWLEALAREVAGYPRVLCHRDFHARNLMVKGDRIWMVDFQDARLGPYTYDLASLARDSYVALPEDLVAEMIRFFRETSQVSEPEDRFLATLRRTTLQRNLKAIGTFASQAMLRGNRSYLRWIPPTLASVRARLTEGEAPDDPETREILALIEGPLAYSDPGGAHASRST